MKYKINPVSSVRILAALIIGLSLIGCSEQTSETRLNFLRDYAEQKTEEVEGRQEFRHIKISHTIEQGGKLWVTGYIPEGKEEELKTLLQAELSPDDIAWKVQALDAQSFENVKVVTHKD